MRILFCLFVASFLMGKGMACETCSPQFLEVGTYVGLASKTTFEDYFQVLMNQGTPQEKEIAKRLHNKIVKHTGDQFLKLRLSSGMDFVVYLLLNHLEKDFVRFSGVTRLYKGLRRFVRGMRFSEYNKSCTYNRSNTKPFTFYAFPGATHTRFEHSLGVMHVASLMQHAIVNNQRRLIESLNFAKELTPKNLYENLLENENEQGSLQLT